MFSITVPNTPEALKAAADFFAALACPPTAADIEPPQRIGEWANEEARKAILESNAAPPPPPPAAETGTETPPPPPPPAADSETGVELDKDGVPWDARIHSESKGKIGNGTWRKKRGVDKALYATVTAELKAQYAGTATTTGDTMPPPPPPPPAETGSEVPPPPPPPAETEDGGEEDSPPATGAETPFAKLARLTAKVSPTKVSEACRAIGIPGFLMLSQQPDKVPAVASALGIDMNG